MTPNIHSLSDILLLTYSDFVVGLLVVSANEAYIVEAWGWRTSSSFSTHLSLWLTSESMSPFGAAERQTQSSSQTIIHENMYTIYFPLSTGVRKEAILSAAAVDDGGGTDAGGREWWGGGGRIHQADIIHVNVNDIPSVADDDYYGDGRERRSISSWWEGEFSWNFWRLFWVSVGEAGNGEGQGQQLNLRKFTVYSDFVFFYFYKLLQFLRFHKVLMYLH